MIRFIILSIFIFLFLFQPNLHAKLADDFLSPQGDFIPHDPAFKPIRSAFDKFDFDNAIKASKQLIEESQLNAKNAEDASYLLGDIYLYMAERKNPFYFKVSINAYGNARNKYPNSKRALPSLMKIGMIYAKIQLYYEALGSFNRIIKNYPNSVFSVPARIKRGKVYLEWGKFDKAIIEFDLINPALLGREAGAFLLLDYAEAYYQKGDLEEAYNYYGLLSLQNPILQMSQSALYQYGVTAHHSKLYPVAREAFFILHNKYPRGEFSLLSMARIGDSYRLQGKIKRALKSYDHVDSAHRTGPRYLNATLVSAIGRLHLSGCQVHPCAPEYPLETELGRLAYQKIKEISLSLIEKENRAPFTERLVHEAVIALEDYDFYPDSLEISIMLSHLNLRPPFKIKVLKTIDRNAVKSVNLLIQKNKDAKALGIFYHNRKAFTPPILRGKTGVQLGIGFARSGYFAEAIKLLSPIALTSTSLDHEEADFQLTKAYFTQAEYSLAEKRTQLFIKRYPGSKHISLLELLETKILINKGNKNEAIRKYKTWLKRYPKHKKRDEALKDLGDMAFAEGDMKQAVILYQKILSEKNELIPGLQLTIADTFFQMKNYKMAISHYTEAIEEGGTAEQVDWATFQLAQSYEKLGLKGKGVPLYAQLEKDAIESIIKALSAQKKVEIETVALEKTETAQ